MTGCNYYETGTSSAFLVRVQMKEKYQITSKRKVLKLEHNIK